MSLCSPKHPFSGRHSFAHYYRPGYWFKPATEYCRIELKAPLFLKLTQQISVRLFIRLFKLVGLVIVANIIAGWFLTQQGLGLLLIQRLASRDFPVIFGIVRVLVIIVVLVKLAAELIEIAYNHFTGQTDIIEPAAEKPAVKNGIPKGWLIFSLGLCALFILLAIFGPLLSPNTKMIELHNILQPPSVQHLLGTDQLGRDILSRLLAGFRTDILIGLAVAAVVSIIAAGWAMLADNCRKMDSWWGNTLEDIVMLPRDIICAFPWLALLLVLMSLMTNRGAIFVAITMGLIMLPRAAGMMQEAFRSTQRRMTWRQIVQRVIPWVFAFTAAAVTLYISTISYFGFGMPPTIIELGNMANSGSAFLPQLVIAPLVVLSLLLIVEVVTGEALAERFDFRSGVFWPKMLE